MVDAAWVLSLMIDAQPSAPWRDTYESTATAIARAANANPLPFSSDREERTAALLVSVAWFESAFKQDAEGDYVGVGTARRPTSFCLLQVSETNFRALKVTRDDVQKNVDRCVDAGLRMMHVSWSVCRGEPFERRMDHYCVGGPTCAHPRRDEGGHRIRKAQALFRARPPRQNEKTAQTAP